jgi:hypothetical protein
LSSQERQGFRVTTGIQFVHRSADSRHSYLLDEGPFFYLVSIAEHIDGLVKAKQLEISMFSRCGKLKVSGKGR